MLVAWLKLNYIRNYIFTKQSIYQALGQIITVLSFLSIVNHIGVIGFTSAFSIMIDVYNNFISLTIGHFDPVIKITILFIQKYLNLHIPFREGWRHVFIILQMLFVRDAGTAFSDGRRVLAAIRIIAGTIISVLCSIFIYVSYTQNNLLSNAIFCFIPVVGLFIYDITMYIFSSVFFFSRIGVGEIDRPMSRLQFFIQGTKRSFYRLLIVYAPSLLVFLIPFVNSLPFPRGGTIAIFVGMLANALYWMAYGSSYAFEQKSKGIKFSEAFYSSEAGRFGLAVIGVIFWLVVFLGINAGGRLLGL